LKSRITTTLLVLGLVVFAAGGAYAASAQMGLAKGHHGKKHGKKHAKHHAKKHQRHNGTSVTQPTTTNGTNAAQNQYGTRPGKGCGDRNHVHTGPPGNPSNTSCPPQSQHSGTTKTSAKSLSSHHTAHHTRKKHGHKKHR
jgi:hypothetical protein